jgi:hypothetical protein
VPVTRILSELYVPYISWTFKKKTFQRNYAEGFNPMLFDEEYDEREKKRRRMGTIGKKKSAVEFL